MTCTLQDAQGLETVKRVKNAPPPYHYVVTGPRSRAPISAAQCAASNAGISRSRFHEPRMATERLICSKRQFVTTVGSGLIVFAKDITTSRATYLGRPRSSQKKQNGLRSR